MRFRHLNAAPAIDSNYHVARADIREGEWTVRCVAYGSTVVEAEAVLFDGIGDADIIDLGSV